MLSSRLTAARPVRTVASLRRTSSIALSMRGLVSLMTSFSLIGFFPRRSELDEDGVTHLIETAPRARSQVPNADLEDPPPAPSLQELPHPKVPRCPHRQKHKR